MLNRKQLEKRVTELERRNRELLSAMPEFGVSVLDSTCGFVAEKFVVLHAETKASVNAEELKQAALSQFLSELEMSI